MINRSIEKAQIRISFLLGSWRDVQRISDKPGHRKWYAMVPCWEHRNQEGI